MPRPQFSLKTLLWLMLVVAAFFTGAAWGNRAAWQERDFLQRALDYHVGMLNHYADENKRLRTNEVPASQAP